MKLLTALLITAGLVGCASQPTPATVASVPTSVAQIDTMPAPTGKIYKLKNYDGPEAMESSEVIQASKECIYVKMRPVVVYLTVRTEQGKLRVPVSVNYEPI